MRFILVSTLLSVAFAAPFDAEGRVPSDTTTTRHEAPLAHVIETIEKLRHVGASNGAILEFFANDFNNGPDGVDKYQRAVAWGTRWNIEWYKNLRFDAENNRTYSEGPEIDSRDANRHLIMRPVESVEPPGDLSETDWNALVEKHANTFRKMLRLQNLPNEAINELFEGRLPYRNRSSEMAHLYAVLQWCDKWHVRPEVFEEFTLMVVTGAEELEQLKKAESITTISVQ